MEFHESVEFHRVKSGAAVAFEMQIETKKFPRFSKSFITAKYLSVMEWEEITRALLKIARDHLRRDSTEGSFSTDEVNVSWKIVPKEQSYIKFENLHFTYVLDWIILVKITRHSPLPDRPITPDISPIPIAQIAEYEPKTPNEPWGNLQKSHYKPSTIETSEINKPTEYSPRPLTSPAYGNSNKMYTPSKIEAGSVDEVPSSEQMSESQKMKDLFGSGSEDEKKVPTPEVIALSSEENVNGTEKRTVKKRQLFSGEPLQETPQSKRQSSKKMKVDKQQKNLNNWINTKAETPLKVPQKKPSSKVKSTRSNSSNPLDAINEEGLEKMNNFCEKFKMNEQTRDQRRGELENYAVWDCNDVSKESLKRSIVDFSPNIRNLYANNNLTLTTDKSYNPVLLTTSNVLTENQISYVCQQIENQREPHERGYNEDILTEKILPEFIIHVFCEKFHLSKKEALERLKIQEERRELYPHEESMMI